MRLRFLSALLFAVVAGVLGAAAPASAAEAAPRLWAVDGTWYCNSLTNGSLCIRYVNNYTGIDVKYAKRAGSKIYVRFHYVSHVDQWGSSPSAWGVEHAGGLNSAIWNNAAHVTDCMQGIMESKPSENGPVTYFYTPTISRGSTWC